MLNSITEFDLIELEEVTNKNEFNSNAKHIANKIALSYIRKKGKIDFDLKELYTIKLFNKLQDMMSLVTEDKLHNYIDFKKQFDAWVYMAIQDLGEQGLADEYKNLDNKLLPIFDNINKKKEFL